MSVKPSYISLKGFPGGASGKESPRQWRRPKSCEFDRWVGKTPGRSKWQPTPVFLSGEFHGQRSLAGGLQSTGSQRVGHDWVQRMMHVSDWGATPYAFTIKSWSVLLVIKKENLKVPPSIPLPHRQQISCFCIFITHNFTLQRLFSSNTLNLVKVPGDPCILLSPAPSFSCSRRV